MQRPIITDAARPPKSFTNSYCPLLAGGSLEAPWRTSNSSGVRPFCPEPPRLKRAWAHSLSIAETQIWYRLTTANPPRGEPVVKRVGIRNSFNLFSFPEVSGGFQLVSPPL